MVTEQIIARGVSDARVIAAMRKVERHSFVPKELQPIAYADEPLPVGLGQTISQPYIVAYMTEAAALRPEYRVLEIGTGTGYQTAILAEIVKEVYTIEVSEKLSQSAARRLSDLGYKNVHFKVGDGYAGWPEEAPFDAAIITAAPSVIPEVVADQLKIGGRMVVPIGDFFQELSLITKKESGLDRKSLLPVRFVPMIHRPAKR